MREQVTFTAAEAADCIVAFATPPGQSALAVLRLSGAAAFLLADSLFKPQPNFPRIKDLEGYTMSYGYWLDCRGKALDEVVIAAFRAPHSYTGENLIEISCHGGQAPRRRILNSLLEIGATPAAAGEFSRRAFLNGKLDLSQAEAVMDLIASVSERQGELALAQRRGSVKEAIKELSNKLYQALAKVEMLIEFADEDGLESTAEVKLASDLQSILHNAAEQITDLLESYRQGRAIREGFMVVISGRTNAGKSSLLNALLGEERAIVTDISGTTRDRLDCFVDFSGIPLHLIDTAGIREAADPVEQEGIRRAEAAVREADLVIRLLNPDFQEVTMAQEYAAIDELLSLDREVLLLLGKEDLKWSDELITELDKRYPNLDKQFFSKFDDKLIEAVKERIVSQFEALGPAKDCDSQISNSRQEQALQRAGDLLQDARAALDTALPLELMASSLRSAIEEVAKISGENVSETLIDEIFSRFCVGK
ncbi:MAG: tRNA uridine-5-carboxymethylaminomethyl(34) synthesis GTPase MnmE [Eubacteriales bacterium]|nr:tRNA uridine-5-carboxymethylaminomethyl(34) synthesis GTPase MnmE [Eubacteriales bacterium]